MFRKTTVLLLVCMVAGLLPGGCSRGVDTENRFSRVDEVLVFRAVSPTEFELVNRTPELTGAPMDIHFLPDGDALISLHPGGLVRFNPETGEMGHDYGPGSTFNVELLNGREINGISAHYLTSDYYDEHISLLNREGIEVGRIPAPRGVHDVDLLENGNLLRLDAAGSNVLREVTPTGEVVWESDVPLLNPYEVHVTQRGTYLVSNYDRHSMIEFDRENRIVSETRGFDHPRRFKEIAPDQYIIADADKRRVVVMMPDRQVVPLVEGLNRTMSVAWDPQRSLLLVGVEAFLTKNPDIPEVEPTPFGRAITGTIWFGTTLIPALLLFLGLRYRESLGRACRSTASTLLHLNRWAQPVLLPLGCVFAVGATLCFHNYLFLWGWGLLGAGIAFAFLSVWQRKDYFPEWPTLSTDEDVAEESETPTGLIQRPWLLLAGTALCWFTLLWSIAWPSDTWMILPWIVGPWLCVYAFRRNGTIPFDPVNAIWVVVMLVVAVFFRTWDIHVLPWGLWFDELYAPMKSLMAYEAGPIDPFGTTVLVNPNEFLMPNVYVLMNAYALKYISLSFEMVKAFSFIPGIGIVLATYLLGKWAFGSWAGRVAGMVAACNSWLVCFARWGWLPQWYIMLTVFALAFFVRAWRYRCPRSAAMCGLMIGFAYYTYLPVVITTAALGTLFLIGLLTPERKLRMQQLAIATFMVLIVFGPQWYYYLENPGEFLRRTESASVMKEVRNSGSIQPIITSAQKYLLAFHVDGDFNKRHNSPRVLTDPTTGEVRRDPVSGEPLLNGRLGNPMLDAITGGFMLLGLFFCLFRFYRPAERTLLLVMSTAMMGGILSLAFEAPNTYRLGPVGTICCVMAALPVALWLRKREVPDEEEETIPRWPLAVFIAVLVVLIPLNYYKYFALMPNQLAWPESWNAENHLVYSALSPEDVGSTKLFVHRNFGHDPKFGFYSLFLESPNKGSYDTMISQNTRYTTIDVNVNKPYLSAGTNTIIMPFQHEGIQYEPLLRELYPDAEVEVLQNPWGRNIAVMARVEN